MKQLTRIPLSASAMAELSTLTGKVDGAANPKARAAALWDNKPEGAFTEIRAALKRMASGRDRCMYCEDSEGTDIEHFWPKSTYPNKAFSWSNYLLACSHCNSNHKRTKFPMTNGEPDLLDPTTEVPADAPNQHLRLLPSNGHYQPIGPKGQPSITIFDLNGDERGRKLPQGRRDTLHTLQVLLITYDNYVRNGDDTMAYNIKRAIINQPFASVLSFLLDLARQANEDKTLLPGVAKAIQRHRVAGW